MNTLNERRKEKKVEASSSGGRVSEFKLIPLQSGRSFQLKIKSKSDSIPLNNLFFNFSISKETFQIASHSMLRS